MQKSFSSLSMYISKAKITQVVLVKLRDPVSRYFLVFHARCMRSRHSLWSFHNKTGEKLPLTLLLCHVIYEWLDKVMNSDVIKNIGLGGRVQDGPLCTTRKPEHPSVRMLKSDLNIFTSKERCR